MGLDSVELLVAVEERFNVSFSDYEAENMITVGDMYNGVWGKIKDETDISRKEMEIFIRLIIHDRIGVELELIVPEASFVNELGVD